MLRKELLDKLTTKYSFEKSHSIIQIAIDDGAYENNDVKVEMIGFYAGTYMFSLNWK